MLSWNIGLQGRRRTGQEMPARVETMPVCICAISGQMLWFEEDRLTLLAMLLENVDMRATARLGSPEAPVPIEPLN